MSESDDEDGSFFGRPTPELDSDEALAMRQRLLNRVFGGEASTLGRFQILRLLGQGGMGSVYLAYDSRLDRRVAVKTMRARGEAAGATRLLDEARAMAKLSHPNLVPIFELSEHEGEAFILMEYIEGPTLAGWLKQERRTEDEILRVFCEAGEGLALAHERGFIHGDFKPANVIIETSGRARVMDFGLARNEPGIAQTVVAGSAHDQKPASQERRCTWPLSNFVETGLTLAATSMPFASRSSRRSTAFTPTLHQA